MIAKGDGQEVGPVLDAHRFDETALAIYLKDHLQDFDGELTVLQFLGGQSNPTFLLETHRQSYVLRKKPPGELLPSAHAIDREFRIMQALSGSTVPVPRMHGMCEDTSIIGQMFFVMDYVPGRIITGRGLPDCTPAERSEMYVHMITVLADLHAIDFNTIGLSDFGRPHGYVARQVARWSKQYQASKVEECPDMDALIKWLDHNAPSDERTAIVHGDYRPGNLIFDSALPKVAAVLDWELSTIGHPFADLAYFCMPYRLHKDESPHGLVGLDLETLCIPSEQDILESYCNRARLPELPDFDYYIVFSMFRLAAIQAGVYRRGLDGNASDPRALERGKAYRNMASTALAIANTA